VCEARGAKLLAVCVQEFVSNEASIEKTVFVPFSRRLRPFIARGDTPKLPLGRAFSASTIANAD
jgi:hypothetical protein